MGYVSFDEDYPDIFSFRFYNSSGEYCVLETIASYCIAKKIDITALVEGLNFRILDWLYNYNITITSRNKKKA